jgi:Tol biopolymer transport system component/DNA-binding winged helix-turn-helix (wHTH) protein
MSSNLLSNFHHFRITMAERSNNSIYAFDQFRLDASNLMLYRNGEEISLPPKVVKTLTVLVETRGAIISKDDLIDRVWDDSIVEEANLTQHLYLLRKTLGTKPDGSSYIETLRRRGYRFTGDVQIIERLATGNENVGIGQPMFSAAAVERRGNVLRLVDRRETQAIPDIGISIENTVPAAITSRRPSLALLASIILVLGFGAAAFVFYRNIGRASQIDKPVELTVLRLTNGDYPAGATISADGNYFAFYAVDGETYRLFVQQVGQPSKLEVVSLADKLIHTTTFSPDGRFVYFLTSERKDGSTSLYRVSTIGGTIAKLLDNINGPVSFSPDGTEMVFYRFTKPIEETALIIADKDGKNQRVIATRDSPNLFGNPSWSPDGKLIAVAEYGNFEGDRKNRIAAIELSDGSVSELSTEYWDTVYRMNWLPDGRGLVFVGTREKEAYSTRRDQVYLVSFPDGRSRRLTTDGNRHEVNSLGVASNGAILAVSGNRSSQLWSMDAGGDQATAFQISKGSADGRAGLCPLPDGRISYIARTGEELNVWLANADGSDARQIATGYSAIEELRSDPNGKFLVFSSIVEGNNRLFRVETNGSDLKQLTFGEGREIDSTVSPDGEYVVYDTLRSRNEASYPLLFRVAANGGEPEQLGAVECSQPAYSPDGKMISCIGANNEAIVTSADNGDEIRRFSFPTNATSNFGTGWLPDSSALTLIINEKAASNIWVFPLDRDEPRRLTNFTSGVIYRFAFSPDGSRLFLARGYPAQDAVLITNYR